MVLLRKIVISALGLLVLSATLQGNPGFARSGGQDLPGDPVLKARSERAAAQGIGEGDLPPLPKGVVEPPPLPPPETHVKDTRRGRQATSRRHGEASRSRHTGKHPTARHPSSPKKSTKHKKKGKA